MAITLVIVIANVRLHQDVASKQHERVVGRDVLAQLRFLREAMDDGAAERMQGLFPEGFCFMHALYGWTWVEVAKRKECDAATRTVAVDEARWALMRLESDQGFAPFDGSLDPPHGMFATAYRGWLRGGLLMVQPRNEWQEREIHDFEGACDAIAHAMDRSGPFVCSYPGHAWPCDSVVGVAVLRLHDRLLRPAYADVIERWVLNARGKRVDGLLPHRQDPDRNAEQARGSSQSIIGRFLPEVDEQWGEEEYARFRGRFASSVLGLSGVLEHSSGHGFGDVDSGPLIGGISASASAAMLAAANVHGDHGLADALAGSAECVGMPFECGGRKRYLLGVMPVGDAFLAWAKVSTRWTDAAPVREYPAIVPQYWRWRVHGWSVLLLTIVWSMELVGRYRRRLRGKVRESSQDGPARK